MKKKDRGFSIIMTVYDQAPEIQENLPVFLTQEYEPGYEVIIVDETSTDNTMDVLKLLKDTYPHLYSTFLPKPNRLIVRKKMAFSIGIKAAKNDWIILTKISKTLMAPDILQAINDAIEQDTELTLGYLNKKGILLQPFIYYQDAKYHILKSERKLNKVHEWKRMGYIWGRYDFIVVRKDLGHKLLAFYEQKTSSSTLFGIRLRILWKNLISRSSTTQLNIE